MKEAIKALDRLIEREKSRIKNMCNNEYPYRGLNEADMIKNSKTLSDLSIVRSALVSKEDDEIGRAYLESLNAMLTDEDETPIGNPSPAELMTPDQSAAKLRFLKGECANVREIVTTYLVANGHDGLCEDECGCKLRDLMPCDECLIGNCLPAFIQPDGTLGPEKPV